MRILLISIIVSLLTACGGAGVRQDSPMAVEKCGGGIFLYTLGTTQYVVTEDCDGHRIVEYARSADPLGPTQAILNLVYEIIWRYKPEVFEKSTLSAPGNTVASTTLPNGDTLYYRGSGVDWIPLYLVTTTGERRSIQLRLI